MRADVDKPSTTNVDYEPATPTGSQNDESTEPTPRRVQFARSTSSFTQKSQVDTPEKKNEQQEVLVEKETSPTPSHGRLLPLGQFLIVYACMSLAVLLNSLDQTIGK